MVICFSNSLTEQSSTDEYGGSIENKARIFFEVLDAVKEVIPEEKLELVLYHYMVHLEQLWMRKIPTFEYIIKKLNDYNLAYIHLSEPFTDVSAIPYAVSEIAKHFRPLYNGTLMINSDLIKKRGTK
jgi:N-ethylmaleimide reductase